LNSSGTQNCTYNYDDLGRVGTNNWNNSGGVTCTNNGQTKWQQTFEYDGYYNMYLKSGSLSFTPSYDYTNRNNHILSVPGQSISYDGMGNMTVDNLNNHYTYDAEGRPVTINGLSAVYDAFGRTVELNNGSKQILYGPSGNKFAYMSGQTVQKYYLPLAAGVQDVYDGSGIRYIRYVDWQGSSRMQLTWDGAVVGGEAYAPYGESYAETGTADRMYTGQTQDAIAGPTGMYDFLFRQYSPSQSRWIVPDPAGLAAVDLTDPQTWNRYTYVSGNPLSNTDPLGLRITPCPPGKDPGTICVDDPQPSDPGENSDRSQPPARDTNPGGQDQPIPVYWGGIGPAPAQAGLPNPYQFRNGKWQCTRTVNGGEVCVGAGTSTGDLITPGTEGLFHGPGTAQTWNNASGAANTLGWVTVVFVGSYGAVAAGPAIPQLVQSVQRAGIATAATAQTYGVPVNTMEIWFVNNFRAVTTGAKWLYKQCQTYGPC
jgi:RHS repeat-associated protein